MFKRRHTQHIAQFFLTKLQVSIVFSAVVRYFLYSRMLAMLAIPAISVVFLSCS